MFILLTVVLIRNLRKDNEKLYEKDAFVAPDLLQKSLSYFRRRRKRVLFVYGECRGVKMCVLTADLPHSFYNIM